MPNIVIVIVNLVWVLVLKFRLKLNKLLQIKYMQILSQLNLVLSHVAIQILKMQYYKSNYVTGKIVHKQMLL